MGWSATKRSKGRREPAENTYSQARGTGFLTGIFSGERRNGQGRGWWFFTSPCTRGMGRLCVWLSVMSGFQHLSLLSHSPWTQPHVLGPHPTWDGFCVAYRLMPALTHQEMGWLAVGLAGTSSKGCGWLVPHGPWGPVDEQRWYVFFWVWAFDCKGGWFYSAFSLVWRHLGWRRLLQPHRKSSLRESHGTKIMVNNGNEGLLKILWDADNEWARWGKKAQPLGFVSSPWDLRLFSTAAESRLSCVLYIFYIIIWMSEFLEKVGSSGHMRLNFPPGPEWMGWVAALLEDKTVPLCLSFPFSHSCYHYL